MTPHQVTNVPPGALPDGRGLRLAIVQSRFNPQIVDRMTAFCMAELQACGVEADDIAVLKVPGALEIPLTLQSLAQTRRFHALVAIGAVIRGETYHFEVVANESCRGVMDVSLDTGLPIANAILTTENEAQALARVEDKARDAARVAVEMARVLQSVEQPA